MEGIYKFDSSFDKSVFEGATCAFGVFDGVHKGHQYLLSEARKTAQASQPALTSQASQTPQASQTAQASQTSQTTQASQSKLIALTFDIDPDELFCAQKLRKLMTNDARLCALKAQGVDMVVALPFTREFAQTPACDFLDKIFSDCAPTYMHVGQDFHFGARAEGDVDMLCAWGENHNMKVCAHSLKSADGAPITATRIRKLLGEGSIEQANELLGHTWSVQGKVRPGRTQGRTFGIKTANLHIPSTFMVLKAGVYAARAYVGGAWYKAAVNVGVPPTFERDACANCEVHLLDFNNDIYEQSLRVEFCHWLRGERVFESKDELIETINANIDWVRKNLVIP